MQGECYEKEILEDGIVVYRIKSTSAECAEIWYQDVADVFARAVEQQARVRIMYDVRGLSLRPSPQIMQRAIDLGKLNLPDDWRVATLTGSVLATGIVNYIKKVSLSPEMLEKSRIFADEIEALAWLRNA